MEFDPVTWRLYQSLAICSIFVGFEVIAGIWSGSLAILSDALHMLSDCSGLALSLVAYYWSNKQHISETFPYGYKRIQVLAALFSVASIWIVTLFLVIEAFQRLLHPQDVNPRIMFWSALVGVFFNIVLAMVLHYPKNHDHSHHCNHSIHEDLNLKSASLHVFGDLISSLGVLLASVILNFYPTLTFVDPICTLFFAILVIYTTVGLAKSCIFILLQASSSKVNISNIKELFLKIEGIKDSNVKVWQLTPDDHVASVHVFLDPRVPGNRNATLDTGIDLSVNVTDTSSLLGNLKSLDTKEMNALYPSITTAICNILYAHGVKDVTVQINVLP